ncbi:MAG: hypothetical protein KAX49_04850 [Halanaerobiales bacterium]|nr:hypothetical protein [Halanaerobiales bacterium]
MNKAKENYSTGKQRTVKACELEKYYLETVPSNSKRFICPECGEYVAFVRRDKYKSYFRHCKINETTAFCEQRCNSTHDYSIYEKVGFPLYLKKGIGQKFDLYLGFYNINESQISIAQNSNFQVSILPYNEDVRMELPYRINSYNFSANSTTLKRINFISSRYKLKYSSKDAEKLFIKRWGSEVEGIINGRALFTYHSNGGRKIRINDEITTDTDYYYLCNDRHKLNRNLGLVYEKCGVINLEYTYSILTYYVYRVQFKNFNEKQFKRLHDYCRENLKVSLIYKPSELVAIWPPAIQKNNELNFFKREKNALFILKSQEKNARTFIHTTNSVKEVKGTAIGDKMYLVNLPIVSENVAININEKYNSINFFLSHYKGIIKTVDSDIIVYDDQSNILNSGVHYKLPAKKSIKIVTSTKCRILHLKNNQVFKAYPIDEEAGIIIEKISYGDEILVMSGVSEYSLLKFIGENTQKQIVLDNDKLFFKLSRTKGSLISPPIWIRKLLNKIENRSKIYSLIRKYIFTNKIPVEACRILEEEYNKMKESLIYEKC